uniref:flagellar hook-length control protein FliK n=1 Tax=uncultured Caulobacter sp. TaxID=158749 RepID=UPI0025EE5935
LLGVGQFEISHDGGGSGGAVGPAERTYKARFSIDVEPLGPVHAMVTLTGSRTRVSLWAERAETIARLRAGEESLGAALREAELTPEVAVHSGAPPSPGGVSPLGHFVDQAS